MVNVLIIGAGGQIPEVLIPLIEKQVKLKLTLFGRNATNLPYERVTKTSGDASNFSDLTNAIQNQDIVYMNFDNKSVTEMVIKAMNQTGVKRIIQAEF